MMMKQKKNKQTNKQNKIGRKILRKKETVVMVLANQFYSSSQDNYLISHLIKFFHFKAIFKD